MDCISEIKNKQLRVIRDEKLEKHRKTQRGMQALKEIQKYQKRADLLIRRVPFQGLVREIVQKRRGRIETAKLGSVSFTRSWRSIYSSAYGTGKLCAIHAKWVTIMPRDIQLAHRIWGDF